MTVAKYAKKVLRLAGGSSARQESGQATGRVHTRRGAILRVFMNVGLVILLVALTGMGQEHARPQWSTSALEQRIHESINAERVRNRLPGLELDEDLSRIARAHSLDMATRDFFDHVKPEGRTPSDRGDASGLPCRRDLPDGSYAIGLAENIFQNNLYDRVMFVDGKPSYAWNSLEHIAATTVQGWMESLDQPIGVTRGLGPWHVFKRQEGRLDVQALPPWPVPRLSPRSRAGGSVKVARGNAERSYTLPAPVSAFSVASCPAYAAT